MGWWFRLWNYLQLCHYQALSQAISCASSLIYRGLGEMGWKQNHASHCGSEAQKFLSHKTCIHDCSLMTNFCLELKEIMLMCIEHGLLVSDFCSPSNIRDFLGQWFWITLEEIPWTIASPQWAFNSELPFPEENSVIQELYYKLWNENQFRRDLPWDYYYKILQKITVQRNLFVSFYCIYLNSDKLLGPYFRHLNPLEERIYYVCVYVCMTIYVMKSIWYVF